MSTIKVTQSHNLPLDQARDKLKDFEQSMSKYGVSAKWSGNKATLKGLGVSGGIALSPSEVGISLKLGMMAKAAGVDPARLQASIEKRLKAAFEG